MDKLAETYYNHDAFKYEGHTAELVANVQFSSFGTEHILARRLAETHDLMQELDEKLWKVRDYVTRWIGNEISEQTVLSALCVLFSEESTGGERSDG